MKNVLLKHPRVRENLLSFLGSLGDREYQHTHWVEENVSPSGEADNFDMVAHFLLDDGDFLNNAEAQIGFSLYNAREAGAVRDISAKIDSILSNYGRDEDDKIYISSPEWDDIVKAAQSTLKLLLNENHN